MDEEMRACLDRVVTKAFSGPRRYPVVRTGPREPIPWVVRVSVYQRDGYRCRTCGWSGKAQQRRDGLWVQQREGLELDHRLPWSAGGSDGSDNLRTLCQPCNTRRSNWDDGEHEGRGKPPTTWWCWECWRHPDLDPDPDFVGDDPEPQRVYRPPWRNGINLNRVPYVTDTTVQVYCAWCWGYGGTDRAFIEPQQAELAALCEVAA